MAGTGKGSSTKSASGKGKAGSKKKGSAKSKTKAKAKTAATNNSSSHEVKQRPSDIDIMKAVEAQTANVPATPAIPPHSCKVLFYRGAVEVKVTLRKIPEQFINIQPTATHFVLDTLLYNKKYSLNFPYPKGVKVNPTAEATFVGGILKVELPIVDWGELKGAQDNLIHDGAIKRANGTLAKKKAVSAKGQPQQQQGTKRKAVASTSSANTASTEAKSSNKGKKAKTSVKSSTTSATTTAADSTMDTSDDSEKPKKPKKKNKLVAPDVERALMESAVAAAESKIAEAENVEAAKLNKIEKAGQEKTEKKEKRAHTKSKVQEVAKKELQAAVTKKRAEKRASKDTSSATPKQRPASAKTKAAKSRK